MKRKLKFIVDYAVGGRNWVCIFDSEEKMLNSSFKELFVAGNAEEHEVGTEYEIEISKEE